MRGAIRRSSGWRAGLVVFPLSSVLICPVFFGFWTPPIILPKGSQHSAWPIIESARSLFFRIFAAFFTWMFFGLRLACLLLCFSLIFGLPNVQSWGKNETKIDKSWCFFLNWFFDTIFKEFSLFFERFFNVFLILLWLKKSCETENTIFWKPWFRSDPMTLFHVF